MVVVVVIVAVVVAVVVAGLLLLLLRLPFMLISQLGHQPAGCRGKSQAEAAVGYQTRQRGS